MVTRILIFASAADSKIGFAQNNGSDGFIPSGNHVSNMTQVDQIEIADLDGDSDMDYSCGIRNKRR